MVQTRAAAKRIESGEQLPQDAAVAPSPTKKRRQDGAVTFKKRHRGKPGELCQLNLDVLFLLAAYVHPLDLLSLARTCKSLRELLMDKASAFVWKTARRQVNGLPDCPDDLTEPEYANLVFYARCHGCGKYTKKIFWWMRRRYCPDCRQERLCCLSSCPDIVLRNYVIPAEFLTINDEKTNWVDKDQLDSLIREYDRSSDKEQFLKERRDQCLITSSHARECEQWEEGVAFERKLDLEERRKERYQSIFERLRQLGYGPEIECFGQYEIKQSRKSFFKTSKPLTDKEWAFMLAEWLETMQNFRSRRIERTVYRPRRDLLASAYDSYVKSRSPNTPVFELLPYVTDVARFPPFREVIYAPEGIDLGANPFEPAFEQLPALVDEWKKQLDNQFAELVEIPPHLSSNPTSDGVASSSPTPTELSQAPVDKLRLACAVFSANYTVAFYPDVLSCISMAFHVGPIHEGEDSERTMSILERFGVTFAKTAPYIIHACGLDPSVATVEDVDRRNVRLKCLLCRQSYVMTWRCAMRHTLYFHEDQTSLPRSQQWQLISDEYMDAIQATELSLAKEPNFARVQCLLCHPRVGCVTIRDDITDHIVELHGIERDAIQLGVHYKGVSLHDSRPALLMVEEGGITTFKDPFQQLCG